MKQLIIILSLIFVLAACSASREKVAGNYNLPLDSLSIRDPFILADSRDNSYYLHANDNPNFKVYQSKNLRDWKNMGYSFTAAKDFWGKHDFWAPDVYRYKRKYYMLATFSGPGTKRGTSILIAKHPLGPFQPLVNKSITPADQMSLDGTLYFDADKNPWLVYCHEWLEATNGEILAQRLTPDLKEAIGEPILLFTANTATWAGALTAHGTTGYVTDAPFPYKAKNGHLLMLWSSFTKQGKYAIGVARSVSGKIEGPWRHDAEPLNNDDGGHAMLFKDFSGNLNISYHSPNSGPNVRARIFRVTENDGIIKILK